MKHLLAIAALCATAACEDMTRMSDAGDPDPQAANLMTQPELEGNPRYAEAVLQYPDLTEAEFNALDTDGDGELNDVEARGLDRYAAVNPTQP